MIEQDELRKLINKYNIHCTCFDERGVKCIPPFTKIAISEDMTHEIEIIQKNKEKIINIIREDLPVFLPGGIE